jgi:maleate isomerase
MAAQRLKVGAIVPSSNTTLEPDFQRALPANASLHTARIWLVDTTAEDLAQMNEEAETAARHLGSAAVDAIAYCCTSGSFLGGPGYDDALLAKLVSAAGGTPTVGTSPAMVEALKLSGIRKVSVVTPYTDAINERLTVFLEGHGFEVLSMAGQQIVPNLEIGAQTPEVIATFAKANLSPEADGLFLSCTNWRSMEVAEALEQETGLPVVTSNQATIWATFRALGIRESVAGYGKLLSSLSSPAKA